MKPEETIDFYVRWAWLKISKMYNQEATKHGITQSIGFILLNIDPKLGTPSTQLGPKMGMEPTSLSRTLKAMEDKGFISRKKDAVDQRVMRIFLTDLGKTMRGISKQSVVRFNEKILEEVSEEKFRNFKEVIQIIEQHTVKAS
jgi:MarR family transcriptional regulator, organic hydroperoxide resistance regulator